MRPSWVITLFTLGGTFARPQGPGNFQIQRNDSFVQNTAANATITVTIASTAASTTTCSSTTTAGPLATLLPVIHDDHDLNDIVHLTPQCAGAGAPIHYAVESQPDQAGIFAVATPKWKCPSVVLDHSILIASVELRDGVLIIHFADKASFDHCLSEWTAGEMVLVTYTEGCGDYHLGQRCYYHTFKIVFDAGSLSCFAFGQARPIEEITVEVNVWWGTLGGISYGSPGGSGGGSETSGGGTATTSAAPSSTSSCVAPIDTKYGLPTACLGPYFDDDLDSGLGYFNTSDFGYSSVLSREDVDNIWITDSVQRRWAVWSSVVSSVRKFANKTKEGIKQITTAAKEAAQALGANIKKAGTTAAKISAQIVDVYQTAAQLAVNVVLGKPNTFEKDFDKLLLPRPAKECEEDAKNGNSEKTKNSCKPKGDAKGVKTPWGDSAVLLKTIGTLPDTKDLLPVGGKKQTTIKRASFINIYCVQCGIQGSMKTKGNVTIQALRGITEGFLEANLDMSVGLGLGIYAQYLYEDKFRKNLWDIPLSPFTLGFITVGPILSVGTELRYNLNMTGTMLARADVSIARAHFVYDFRDGGKTVSRGFKPEFKPSFRADGEINAAVQFGVPLALEFGITTFNGCERCKGTIGIEDMPSIKIAAAISAYVSYNNASKGIEAGLTPLNGCKGISTTLSARNDVNAVAKGFGFIQKNWTIYETKDYVLASYCIGEKVSTTKRSTDLWSGSHIGFEEPRARRDLSNSSAASQTPTTLPSTTAFQKLQATSGASSSQIYDLTPFIVEEVEDLGFNGPSLPSTPYDLDESDFDGFWFSTLGLQGSSGQYVLAACNDGNVYLQEKSAQNDLPFYQTCTTLWAGFDNTVISTPTGEVLHYYANTMSLLNVSRLRTAEETHIPGTSVYVALTPFYYSPDDANTSMLAAVDPEGNIFFPAVCTYKGDGQGAKIYLIGDDIEAGLELLRSPDLEYSITNGEVDECYLLFLDITSRQDGAWAADDAGASERYDADPLDVAFDDQYFTADGTLDLPDYAELPDAGDTELRDLQEVYDDDTFESDGF
ncbi:uncharacterized protein E0L32_009838 [Thyridium curvatum]|uniref:DUF7029 domain-containing protein n=1 Tax=Thyridium curvatum TaxID=1093900 RepID=A0A507AUP3_9PEZI|nr:uncharacterized protein E0L32_009838 [Thyridium curvatum]TPX08649.1 hypothetical protein E0L32_009838 [Thyridium curvatum]